VPPTHGPSSSSSSSSSFSSSQSLSSASASTSSPPLLLLHDSCTFVKQRIAALCSHDFLSRYQHLHSISTDIVGSLASDLSLLRRSSSNPGSSDFNHNRTLQFGDERGEREDGGGERQSSSQALFPNGRDSSSKSGSRSGASPSSPGTSLSTS